MRHLNAAALLAFCVTCSAFADGRGHEDGPGATLAVFDANGNYVGPLIGLEDRPIAAAVTVNGAIILAPLARLPVGAHLSSSKFEWTNSDSYFMYQSSNCSGPPVILNSTEIYESGDTVPVRPSVTIRTGAETIAYIAADTFSTTIATQSQVELPFGCTALGFSTPGWLPASTFSLNRNFPEPLTIRMNDR